MKRVESHIFQGMQRDVSISKQQPQFLWDAENIRLTAREGDTLMSVTNERGSEETDVALTGSYMGHCVLGNYLTVFTTGDKDRIYRITKNSDGSFSTKQLYGINNRQKSLGFDPDHPLQTLGIYENEKIQKVYWTDGINQPRVINIVKDIYNEGAESYYINTSFDFVPEMKLQDSIEIQKLSDSNGSFPAGVIQYAVTYYNKYGQQSNISCVSPLIPVSFISRAGSPEEKISNSFRITINQPDTSFEYLRLYSIQRTSLNGTPICRRVEDIRLGEGGSSGDPYYILVTPEDINTNTFALKISGPNAIILMNASVPKEGDNYELPVAEENVPSVPGLSGAVNCYHLTKARMPYLCIATSSSNPTFVTWGDATDIYITKDPVAGGIYGGGYYIIGAKIENNVKKAAYLLISVKRNPYYKLTQTVSNVVITDNGIIGETIDPQELLYIGGDTITAETIESKDGTLFFGNIHLLQNPIEKYKDDVIKNITIGNNSVRTVNRGLTLNNSDYRWGNSLNSTKHNTSNATNPAGFKWGEHYRLGVQFQHKSGKWSEPVYIPNKGSDDVDQGSFIANQTFNLRTSEATEIYDLPRFTGTLSNSDIATKLYNEGYRRVRGVVVFPTASDRLILAQGVLNPTVASVTAHAQHSPDYQSSWFFRPWLNSKNLDNENNILDGASVEWRDRKKLFGFTDRGSEIQGLPKEYDDWNTDNETLSFGTNQNAGRVDLGSVSEEHLVKVNAESADSVFYVNQQYVTMHSPDFEFDDALKNMDFVNVQLKKCGYVIFTSNAGDIQIETSSPKIGKSSTGFVHKKLKWDSSGGACRRLCAGMFYNDWLVDEVKEGDVMKYRECTRQGYEFGFMVYPWQKSGSLNNDCNRPSGEGTQSAMLKRKIISNILYSRQTFPRDYGNSSSIGLTTDSSPVQLFDIDQIGLVKINSMNYYGNIDTMLNAIAPFSSIYSTGGNTLNIGQEISIHEDALNAWKEAHRDFVPYMTIDSTTGSPIGSYYTFTLDFSSNNFLAAKNTFWRGTWKWPELISRNVNAEGGRDENGVGHENRSLLLNRDSIRMKYKSTPHMVMCLANALTAPVNGNSTIYNSLHLAELCRNGNKDVDFGGTTADALQANVWVPAGEAVTLKTSGTTFYYDWGDTWYQRYDCLKTYPFTHEDENQIVEIGSFMVETHVNIDGRYDRNRGQDSNLYVDPENFNLINPVYSQLDNFFNYKIMDSDFYKLNSFPATVAWTLQKNNASEVDAWTNITLGNTLDMDGNAGKVTSVNTSMDTLYCFQERGVSQIMFNSRVQIPTSDGVPIEISNNYKVDGSHYISNTIGCPNKFAIAKSPMGLYFVDGVGSTLYLLQGNQMQNISDNHGMGYWFSQQDTQNTWVPHSYGRNGEGMRLCYDNVNGDLYIMPEQGKALCYSDQLQQFVSFYDYYACGLFNIGNSVHALTNEGEQDITVSLHNLFTGEYNKLLGTYYPSSITFVSNADMQLDKIFTNLELRADFYKGDELQHMHFFDTIRAWNEYQDTDWIDEYGNLNTTSLEHKYFPYGRENTSIASNVKKKFRIWRVDIPRAKKWIAYTEEEKQAMIDSGKYTTDTVPAGHFINVNDRIRNTWCKIKLTMNVPPQELEGYEPYRMEMHDTSVIYYI